MMNLGAVADCVQCESLIETANCEELCPNDNETFHNVVFFSFSDRGLQEKLGLWREQRSDG